MVTKIALKMMIAPETSREHLLGHVITLNGEVYHHVLADGFTTPCGTEIIGAPVLPVAEMRGGRLCERCVNVVKALRRDDHGP
jgi:hypothetical protein